MGRWLTIQPWKAISLGLVEREVTSWYLIPSFFRGASWIYRGTWDTRGHFRWISLASPFAASPFYFLITLNWAPKVGGMGGQIYRFTILYFVTDWLQGGMGKLRWEWGAWWRCWWSWGCFVCWWWCWSWRGGWQGLLTWREMFSSANTQFQT